MTISFVIATSSSHVMVSIPQYLFFLCHSQSVKSRLEFVMVFEQVSGPGMALLGYKGT